VGQDLCLAEATLRSLPEPRVVLGELFASSVDRVEVRVPLVTLSALQAPLYLLHTLGWLDSEGAVRLPDHLAESLALETPAMVLRRITAKEADFAGFVPIAKVAGRLWEELRGEPTPPQIAAWMDRVFGDAIDRGTIEVQEWAPGQPRHGRGLGGDRDRKLVCWTIHDDFALPEGGIDGEEGP
jgi:hypothetical protein